jgi:hypothetical protein
MVKLDFSGKLVMECTIETKASTILQFFRGLNGNLHTSPFKNVRGPLSRMTY